ncbi:MAG: hypothetical protein JXR94_07700 [Candidatus Hydrogenedentes bacterium]|nr:hypothetical protein [Candidatus Hydrogenedentota bacterium]
MGCPCGMKWVACVAALCGGAFAGAEEEGPATDWRYCWPRDNQIVLDGAWHVAFTDPDTGTSLPEGLDSADWFEATLPAEAHWALYRAGKGPHPYEGRNATTLRWVEDKSWWYRKRFQVPAEFRGEHIRLAVEGVDYYGHYWLNGAYLGRSEGAFGNTKFVVSNLRFGGENEIVVRADCAGYKLGKEGGAPWASLVKSELWSGWKLGAYDFNTVGVWQPLRLVSNNWPCLERPFLRTLEIREDAARIRATVDVHTVREGEEACEVALAIAGEGASGPVAAQRVTVTPGAGLNLVDVDVEIPNPRLWWPVGMGEQPLYRAEFELRRGEAVVDRLVVPFGVRTIERKAVSPVRRAYEDKGWVFHVNGRPFFVKGTNWMPIDALADVQPERYEWLLSMARDAGIQMIRIWGGGIIEPDVFYEYCDRFGILVWQDFPLTCSWRAEGVNREIWENTVRWAIFRLRNHPSLAFWCGGNEFKPDLPANADLVAACRRNTRILDGTRPFMAASPDEGDIHGYPQWDAPWGWRTELNGAPFVSEWGSHGMPSYQTYREMVDEDELKEPIGPTLLKMDEALMKSAFPDITYHWVEFAPSRLPQMLSRASAFDNLAEADLERFTEAVAAGAGEFYKISAEAARHAYPGNGGLLFWVWKRPWPIVAIQIVDGLGQPLQVYYDVKRAYSSPWPCLHPPHLNYIAGERVTMPTYVLTDKPLDAGMRLNARLVGGDLTTRRAWRDLPVPASARPSPGAGASPGASPSPGAVSEAVAGPELEFTTPEDAARSCFFMVLELVDGAGALQGRNVYAFRCPPQLEDAAFRAAYREKPSQGLVLTEGPWVRAQVAGFGTELSAAVVGVERESATRARLDVEVANTGERPAVMTRIHVPGELRYVADDAYFWLEPAERRTVRLRIRIPDGYGEPPLTAIAQAWNAPDTPAAP